MGRPSQSNPQVTVTRLARLRDITGGSETARARRKATFHRHGTDLLNHLARAIGLRAGTFSVRSEKGHASMPGNVTLLAEHLYVDLREPWPGDGISVIYRSKAGHHDFTAGTNAQSTTMRELAHGGLEGFTIACRGMVEARARAAATWPLSMRHALNGLAGAGPTGGTGVDGEVIEDDLVN